MGGSTIFTIEHPRRRPNFAARLQLPQAQVATKGIAHPLVVSIALPGCPWNFDVFFFFFGGGSGMIFP